MQTIELTNEMRLAERVKRFNARTGPRVGDWLKLTVPDPRCPEFTRFTHDWGDSIQTGGGSGSYYFNRAGYLDYSGGLDSGINHSDIDPTPQGYKRGGVWFFDDDISGAGRGVDFTIDCRVFVPVPGANLDGIDELRCPYHLSTWNLDREEKHHPYLFTVSQRAVSHRAFHTAQELRDWAAKERLELPAGFETVGSHFPKWPTAKGQP